MGHTSAARPAAAEGEGQGSHGRGGRSVWVELEAAKSNVRTRRAVTEGTRDETGVTLFDLAVAPKFISGVHGSTWGSLSGKKEVLSK